MLSVSDYAVLIIKQVVKMNFEPGVNKIAREMNGNKSNFEVFATGKKGWFNIYMTEIREKMLTIDTSNHPKAKDVIDYFNIALAEPEKTLQEFMSLFPEVREDYASHDLLFSHNDIQENNLIYKQKENYIELIDFEYSALNFRGADIASMINEMTYEYNTEIPDQFAFHPEAQVGFEKDGFIFNACLRYLEA